MAHPTPSLHLPFHSDFVLVGERRRGLLRQAHAPSAERGVFKSIVDLQTAVNRFITEADTQSKPFVWTKHPDTILAAVKRGRQTLEPNH